MEKQLDGIEKGASMTKAKIEDDEVDVPMVLSFLGAWSIEAEKAGLKVRAGNWEGYLVVMVHGATYEEFLAANGGD